MHVKQPVVSRGVTCCSCQSESQDAAILGELAAHVSALLESSPAASHCCKGRTVHFEEIVVSVVNFAS